MRYPLVLQGLRVVTAALALAACAPSRPAAVAPGEAALAQNAAAARVRPGDRVVLRIWNEPEMSDTFSVSERGEVTLPKLGVVPVDDRGIVALQDSLRSAYAVYLRNPAVEVRVLRRVGVVGEVRQPGIFWTDLTMTLPDVIARAGGLTEAGSPDKIEIQRGTQRLRYGRDGRESLMVAQLQSGDQVLVGRRGFFARNPLAAATSAVTLVGYFVTVILPEL